MFQTYIKNFHAKRTVTQTVAARKDALMDGVSSIFIRKKKMVWSHDNIICSHDNEFVISTCLWQHSL